MNKLLLAFILALPLAALAADTDRVRALVRQLGADTFKEREAAQKELSTLPRTALPILREFENTKDPEIKDRLQTAIHAILTDTSRIPQKFFVHRNPTCGNTVTSRKDWLAHTAEWLAASKISLCQTNGRSASGGHFAQSFTARAPQLRAVAVQTYPIGAADGWLSLDLRADNNGKPDTGVLARSWLRLEKRCAPHGSFAVFTFPETALDNGKPYWFTLVEHPADNGSRSMTNHRLDLNNTTDDMRILGRKGCASFILLTDSPEPSWLREATEDERKTIPTPPASTFEWWNHDNSDNPTNSDG
jgi:hypothetical protein